MDIFDLIDECMNDLTCLAEEKDWLFEENTKKLKDDYNKGKLALTDDEKSLLRPCIKKELEEKKLNSLDFFDDIEINENEDTIEITFPYDLETEKYEVNIKNLSMEVNVSFEKEEENSSESHHYSVYKHLPCPVDENNVKKLYNAKRKLLKLVYNKKEEVEEVKEEPKDEFIEIE